MHPKRIDMANAAVAAAAVFAVAVAAAAATVPAALSPERGTSSGRPSLGAVLDAHCRAKEQLKSLRAHFTQTKVFAVFDEREESAGEFAFRRPGMILWRFTSPDTSTTVIRGDEGWTVLPHIRQVQTMRLEGSSADRVMSIVGFGSCGKRLTEDFDITLKGMEDSLTVLEMVPVAEDIAPYFSLIELGLDPGDFLPRRIVFHEHSGDLLIFQFSGLRPGARVSEAEFDFTVPDGYELIKY